MKIQNFEWAAIPRAIQESIFGKAGAQILKQQSGAEAAHVQTHGQCRQVQNLGCQRNQNRFLNHERYKGYLSPSGKDQASHLSSRVKKLRPTSYRSGESPSVKGGVLQKKGSNPLTANLPDGNETHNSLRPLCYRVAEIEKNSQNKLFLNGRTTWIQAPSNASDKLAKHLEVSNKIIEFVHQRIFVSRNYPNRLKTCYIPDHYLDTVLQYIRKAGPKKERLERVVQLKIGNCGEMASLGLFSPEAKSTYTELCDILPGDHCFLIIGRDPSTDPKKPESWNKDAVICDPWANAYYPVSKIPKFLYNYKGLIKLEKAPKHSNPYAPQVELFNPKEESLHLFTNQKPASHQWSLTKILEIISSVRALSSQYFT